MIWALLFANIWFAEPFSGSIWTHNYNRDITPNLGVVAVTDHILPKPREIVGPFVGGIGHPRNVVVHKGGSEFRMVLLNVPCVILDRMNSLSFENRAICFKQECVLTNSNFSSINAKHKRAKIRSDGYSSF